MGKGEQDAHLLELSEDLQTRAELLKRQREALTGADISIIRHSDGGIDLAKRVVNLQGAADWAVEYMGRAASAIRTPAPQTIGVADLERLRTLSGEASYLEGQIDPDPHPIDKANRLRIKAARDKWREFDGLLDSLIARAALSAAEGRS